MVIVLLDLVWATVLWGYLSIKDRESCTEEITLNWPGDWTTRLKFGPRLGMGSRLIGSGEFSRMGSFEQAVTTFDLQSPTVD